MSYEIFQNDHLTNNVTYWSLLEIYRTVNFTFIFDIFYFAYLIIIFFLNFIYNLTSSYNYFGSFVNMVQSLFFQILLEEDIRNIFLRNIFFIFFILFWVFSNLSKIAIVLFNMYSGSDDGSFRTKKKALYLYLSLCLFVLIKIAMFWWCIFI